PVGTMAAPSLNLGARPKTSRSLTSARTTRTELPKLESKIRPPQLASWPQGQATSSPSRFRADCLTRSYESGSKLMCCFARALVEWQRILSTPVFGHLRAGVQASLFKTALLIDGLEPPGRTGAHRLRSPAARVRRRGGGRCRAFPKSPEPRAALSARPGDCAGWSEPSS